MPLTQCLVCNQSFYVKPSHQKMGWGKYCSISCRHKSQLQGKTVNCLICDKPIYRPPSKVKHSKSGNFFCSKTCQTIWRNSYYVAEDHPNWHGGINVYRKILLNSGKKYQCCTCRLTNARVLVAHHIDHNRYNNSPDNLAWLCLNCHFLVHHDPSFEDNFKKVITTK